jgi:hypothetical protein
MEDADSAGRRMSFQTALSRHLLRRGEEWTGLPRLRCGKTGSIPGKDVNPKSECAAGELRAAKRARRRRDAAGEGTSRLEPVRGLWGWTPQGLCPRHGAPARPKGFPARFLSPGCLSSLPRQRRGNPVYSEKVLSSYLPRFKLQILCELCVLCGEIVLE